MASFGAFAASLDGWTVVLTRDSAFVGRARWDGRHIVDRPRLHADDEALDRAVCAGLEAGIEREVAEALDAQAALVNSDGVDLGLIEEMIRLSPRQRLERLQGEAASIQCLMGRAGDAAR